MPDLRCFSLMTTSVDLGNGAGERGSEGAGGQNGGDQGACYQVEEACLCTTSVACSTLTKNVRYNDKTPT